MTSSDPSELDGELMAIRMLHMAEIREAIIKFKGFAIDKYIAQMIGANVREVLGGRVSADFWDRYYITTQVERGNNFNWQVILRRRPEWNETSSDMPVLEVVPK